MKKNVQVEGVSGIERSVGSIIGELVSKDGMNPHMIVNSNLLLGWMRKDGLDVPKSRTTIAKYVHEEAENLRDGVMKELAQMKEEGKHMQQKFSLSLDEATTRSKYRVMNIELYSEKKNYNLGMVLVDKTCPAETMVSMTVERLKRFGVNHLTAT